jgi:hypothetical protein
MTGKESAEYSRRFPFQTKSSDINPALKSKEAPIKSELF